MSRTAGTKKPDGITRRGFDGLRAYATGPRPPVGERQNVHRLLIDRDTFRPIFLQFSSSVAVTPRSAYDAVNPDKGHLLLRTSRSLVALDVSLLDPAFDCSSRLVVPACSALARSSTSSMHAITYALGRNKQCLIVSTRGDERDPLGLHVGLSPPSCIVSGLG